MFNKGVPKFSLAGYDPLISCKSPKSYSEFSSKSMDSLFDFVLWSCASLSDKILKSILFVSASEILGVFKHGEGYYGLYEM